MSPRGLLSAHEPCLLVGWNTPVFSALQRLLSPLPGFTALAHAELPGSGDHCGDLLNPATFSSVVKVDTLIYVATGLGCAQLERADASERRAQVERMTHVVCTVAAAATARRLIVITSAQVYEAPDQGVDGVAETAAVQSAASLGLTGDAIAVEQLVADTRHTYPTLPTTVIRPAALVGPGVSSAITAHFAAPRLLVLRDHETRWQFCHVDDVASAVRTVLDGPDGAAAVASPGWLTQQQVEECTGMRRIEVSRALAESTAQRLHRVGALKVPPSALDDIFACKIVEPRQLTRQGWKPMFTNEECLEELMQGLRHRWQLPAVRTEAAVGAASAAVAMVATAALVRRSRRKGRST